MHTFGQSIIKESTKISDSTDYFLDIASYNKDYKKSFSKAVGYAEKAIEYAEKNNLEEKLPYCYLFLGNTYFEFNNTDKALHYFLKSLELIDKKKPSNNLAFLNYGIGKCYLKKQKLLITEKYFNNAIQLFKKTDFLDAVQMVTLQLGNLEIEKGNEKKAIDIFREVIANSSENDLFNSKSEAFHKIGMLYTKENNNEEALIYFKNALEQNKFKTDDLIYERALLSCISKEYKKLGNLEQSIFYLEAFSTISDSIGKKNLDLLYQNSFDKLQFDKQTQLINVLDQEKKSQEKTIRFSKLVAVLSISLIIILSLLSLSLYKNNKIKIQTYKLLKAKNKELHSEKVKVEKASKARSEFLAAVSHELRTPLNAINGITYLLLHEKPKESQLEYLKSLEFSGKYLLHFINDILEINRLESDKIESESIPFSLKDLVQNIILSFKEFIDENNVSFQLDLDQNIPQNSIGDPTKVSQILINLVNNAIKFSRNGNVWLKINVVKSNFESTTLHFVVKDTGIGIPKEKQDNIFENFNQGSVEINRTYGGTGLGLPIVKRVLHILGGTLEFESEENVGTTFSFTLKFKNSTSLIVEDIINENTTSKKLKHKKILLVEDNKINQMITQKLLLKKNIECFTIDNGEESIEHLKTNAYDLILMDVHLPGINGTEATAEIRKFDTVTPIIALTAISLNENRDMLLSFGMNEVIMKPFDPENFYTIISRFIN